MFDAALLESRKGRRFGDRRKSLPVAIALHAAVIAAFVGAAIWNTGEPPEPVIPVVFSLPSPPPAPLGTGGHHATDTNRNEHPHPAVAPEVREVPAVAQQTAVADPVEPDFEGPETEGPPGDWLGTVGGTNDSLTTGPGSGSPAAPIHLDPSIVPPVLVSRLEPDYPESMRRGRMEGVVILEAVITASGEVDDVHVLKSAGAVLDRAASDAVRRWRYRPATLNGRAVSVYLTVTVTYGLRS
jgi:periplasmic protein TonB